MPYAGRSYQKISFKNLFSDIWNENEGSGARNLTTDYLYVAISHLRSMYSHQSKHFSQQSHASTMLLLLHILK